MARIGAKLCQHAFQTIPDVSFFDAENCFSAKILDRKFCFLPCWHGFWGSTNFRTSKSASSSNFALDRLFQRSVRPKNIGFAENLGSQQKFSPDYRCLLFWRTFWDSLKYYSLGLPIFAAAAEMAAAAAAPQGRREVAWTKSGVLDVSDVSNISDIFECLWTSSDVFGPFRTFSDVSGRCFWWITIENED